MMDSNTSTEAPNVSLRDYWWMPAVLMVSLIVMTVFEFIGPTVIGVVHEPSATRETVTVVNMIFFIRFLLAIGRTRGVWFFYLAMFTTVAISSIATYWVSYLLRS